MLEDYIEAIAWFHRLRDDRFTNQNLISTGLDCCFQVNLSTPSWTTRRSCGNSPVSAGWLRLEITRRTKIMYFGCWRWLIPTRNLLCKASGHFRYKVNLLELNVTEVIEFLLGDPLQYVFAGFEGVKLIKYVLLVLLIFTSPRCNTRLFTGSFIRHTVALILNLSIISAVPSTAVAKSCARVCSCISCLRSGKTPSKSALWTLFSDF